MARMTSHRSIFRPSILAAACVALALAGCAGSTTPLPDLAELPRQVLSASEQKAAVVALENKKNAADVAVREIERERTK